jgi:Transposase DDE domain
VKTKSNTAQHATTLLQAINALLPLKWHFAFECILQLFLCTNLRTTLENLQGISSSTASRFFAATDFQLELAWEALLSWEIEQLRQASRVKKAGRRPPLYLRVDLTSIEKTAKSLPFLRVFNKVKGIHLVVIHVSYGNINFPTGYRIYDPKMTSTPIALALELLQGWSPRFWGGWDVRLLADAGYLSDAFLEKTRAMGFQQVSVGGKSNLKLRDGRSLQACKKGEVVALHHLPKLKLWVSYVDLPRKVDGKDVLKRFFVLSTSKGTSRTLLRVHGKRWWIESFFKVVKYDFGLKETRLRSEQGIKAWILMCFLAYAIVSVERASHGRVTKGQVEGKFKISYTRAAIIIKEVLCARALQSQVLESVERVFGARGKRLCSVLEQQNPTRCIPCKT